MNNISEEGGVAQRIVLVTGGVRSGKSRFALTEALRLPGPRAFIATAEATDTEMAERIRKHQEDRGQGWDTFEHPTDIAGIIREINGRYGAIVIDCLTLWLSNIMFSQIDPEKVFAEFTDALTEARSRREGAAFFIVSNEVGLGIVPANEMARQFRDLAGMLNQRIASIADKVYLTVAGIPVCIKGA